MKILICTGFKTIEKLSLSRSIAERGWYVEHLDPSTEPEIAITKANEFDVFIPRFNQINFRKVMKLTELVEQNTSIFVTSSSYSVLNSMDKWQSYLLYKNNDIPTPETTLIKQLADLDNIPQSYPLIFKPIDGSMGDGIFVANDKEQQLELSKDCDFEARNYIVQHYIEESAGGDRRFFVVDSQVIAAMERRPAPNSKIANLAKGGIGVAITPNETESHLALHAASLYKSLFVGVDVINTSDGPVVIEVNISPGFKIAQITGIDVQKLMLDAIEKKYNERHACNS